MSTHTITGNRPGSQADYLLPRLAQPCESERLSETQRAVRDEIAAAEWNWRSLRCPCGSSSDRPVAATDRYGLPLQTVLCRSCGLVRSDPYPDEDGLQWFYRDRYRRLYMPTFSPELIWQEQQERGTRIRRRVEQTIGRVSSVYEVGCSAGGILDCFRQRGARVLGCDYDIDCIEFARERGIDTVAGGLDAICEAPPPELIVFSHVMEHIADPIAVLERLHSSPLGTARVYVEVPGVFYLRSILRYPGRFFHIAHVWNFTIQTLDVVMAQGGYRRIAGTQLVWGLYEPVEPWSEPNVSVSARHAERVAQALKHAETWRRVPSRRRIVRELRARCGMDTEF